MKSQPSLQLKAAGLGEWTVSHCHTEEMNKAKPETLARERICVSTWKQFGEAGARERRAANAVGGVWALSRGP